MYTLRNCVWEITLACCFSCKHCGSGGGKARSDELTREERAAIARTLKCVELTVRRARPIDEAIITHGGVSVKEIDPRTME